MILSYVVRDIVTVNFILNEFSHIIADYILERNPTTGDIELLVLHIPDEHKEEAHEIQTLIDMYVEKERY